MLEIVFEVVAVVTGHCVLWALTLGRWDISNGSSTTATVVGILFWVAVGVGVWFVFFR